MDESNSTVDEGLDPKNKTSTAFQNLYSWKHSQQTLTPN